MLPNTKEMGQFLHSTQLNVHDMKIVGIADPVQGRINVVTDSGNVCRMLL